MKAPRRADRPAEQPSSGHLPVLGPLRTMPVSLHDPLPRQSFAIASVVAALGTLCLSALLTVGCAARDDLDSDSAPASQDLGASVLRPPDGLGLQPVALPDFSEMSEPVEQQMRTRLSSLETRITDRSTAPSELGDAYGQMGMLLLAAARLAAAEACLLNAQLLMPDDVRWPYYLGRLYDANGALEQSIRAYERAVELQPTEISTQVLLGEVLLAQGQTDRAEEVFARAVERHPDSAVARYGIGRVALAQRDHARAVEQLEQALALAPTATSVHYPLALAYRGLGDTERADTHLQQRGDIESLTPDPLRRALDELLESANAYNIRGGRALEVGNLSAAAEYFRQGLALAPSDPSLRQQLGIALYQLGDAKGALQQFERVVRESPGHIETQYSLGVLLAGDGRHQEAIARFSAALEYDPGYLQAREQLADVLARSGRPAESLAHYDRVLEIDPTLADATFGSAMALVRLERYAAARDRLSQGLAVSPNEPTFKHALARLLAAAPDAGVRDGQRAMSLVEELVETQQSVMLGETAAMALAEMGFYDQAVAVQRDVMAAAEQGGLPADLARMAGNLALYEQRQPCRTPFTEDELP